MPDEHGNETREEALERIRIVRATQIFGDTPTDPTIGDVVVPAHDEEGANVAAAEVASQADDGDDGAGELSPEEAKRQNEPLSADEVQEGAEEEDAEDASEENLTAAEKVERIEASDDAEEVDRLVEGDERVTVQRAADKKREELA